MPKATNFPLIALHASDGTRLTKTKNSSYPNVYKFTSHEYTISSIPAFHKAINEVAKSGGCLLKGFLGRPLVNESRAGSTNSEELTPWLCLDLDGVSASSPQAFIADMPKEFKNVSFICQYSASHGVKKGLRCHLFFRLSKMLLPAVIKAYLTHLNFSIPMLKKGITLSKTKMSLKYPLDISVGQNDKLIYVAPPEYKTKFKGKRIVLHPYRLQSVTLDTTRFDISTTQSSIHTLVNKLRKTQGLTADRKFNTKQYKGDTVLRNPTICMVTGEKEERGYKYLNLNGGDSWGYYHKIGRNEILHNFKGEPDYLIKEILPDYYERICKPVIADKPDIPTASSDEPVESLIYIGVRDKKSDAYWVGTYNPNTDELKINTTGSKDKLRDYLKEHAVWHDGYIPTTWNVTYDFDSDIIYDKHKKTLNLYKKTKYIKAAEQTKAQPAGEQLPSNIKQVIDHVFANQADITKHFINWLAYIIQTRKQTRTAWVLHGTQGTGKGILFNKIITPILGLEYSFRTTLPVFEKEWNAFMEKSLCTLVDETQMSDLNKQSTAISNLKQLITDPSVSLRKMRQDAYVVPNHNNFILASNKFDPVQVDVSDRRFNIGPRQETPLLRVMKERDIDKIESELQAFTNYLMHYNVDVRAASKILQTEERLRLQELTQDSGEEVAERLRSGDLKFLIENAPDHEDTMQFEIKSGFGENNGPRTYKSLINLLIKHRGEPINLTRDELRVMYYYLNNLVWATPHKFTKYAGHKGLKIETVDVLGASHRGIRGLVFQCDELTVQNWQKKHAPKIKSKVIRRIK